MLTRGRGGFAVLVALIGSLFAAAPVAHADPPVCLSWTSTGYCIPVSYTHLTLPTNREV